MRPAAPHPAAETFLTVLAWIANFLNDLLGGCIVCRAPLTVKRGTTRSEWTPRRSVAFFRRFPAVWSRLILRLTAVCIVSVVAAMFSCAKAPTVCTVSPIDIEETKSDIRDKESELEKTQAQLAQVEQRLAEREARAADLRRQPPELRQELVRAKKASGKSFKTEEDLGQTDVQAQKP